MDILKCKQCGKVIEAENKNRRVFCSKKCLNLFGSRNIQKFNYPINTGTLGAISELSVCADLMKKGYLLFKSISPSSPYDLVVDIKGVLHKLEVKTGSIRSNGSLSYYVRPEAIYDILAVVFVTGIKYFKYGEDTPFNL